MAAPFASLPGSDPRGDRRVAGLGTLRFVFYGRVSTEDWQDPVTSRARQCAQAEARVRGHGVIVAEFFDVGESRTVAWARRPQSAALVAQLADPGRGWDAVVVGEYERAFYGSQYAAMAPLFEHYGVQLWMPEVGGRVDYQSEHDEKTMTGLGLSSKREITRTSIRVRTADDLRSLAPVGDGADRHAQVLRVGLVGHAQSLPERIGLAARPSRDHLHAH